MQFHRVLRYAELPEPSYPEDSEKPDIVEEYDKVFDRLVEVLSDLYLVDDRGGLGPANAPISMSRYFTPCKHHTIIASSPSWNPDVLKALYDLLQELSNGWTFGIDATDYPPGQARIVVTQDAGVFGYAAFSARTTLDRYGFPPGYGGPLRSAYAYIVDRIDSVRSSSEVRRMLKK